LRPGILSTSTNSEEILISNTNIRDPSFLPTSDIVIRFQPGHKRVTNIENIPETQSLKRLLKLIKKELRCVISGGDIGDVIKLQGGQCQRAKVFLSAYVFELIRTAA
jgi:translation initiation factor 1 (eIF-1/SUI1)